MPTYIPLFLFQPIFNEFTGDRSWDQSVTGHQSRRRRSTRSVFHRTLYRASGTAFSKSNTYLLFIEPTRNVTIINVLFNNIIPIYLYFSWIV